MSITIAKNDPRLRLPGVRRRGAGWQVYRRVDGKQVFAPKPFPIEATAAQLIEAWELLAAGEPEAAAGSLLEKAGAYFPTIAAKPTYGQARRAIEIAILALGPNRPIASITANMIDVMIQAWVKARPIVGGKYGRKEAPRVLAGDTIRKRLSHLQSFFNAMLPAGALNPVKACKGRPKPKPAATRGIPMGDIAKILAAMPDERDTKPGAPRALALGKIRATVAAYTGLDPAQIKALGPADLFLDGPAPYFRTGRDKGDGTGVFDVELIPAGLAALEAFVAAGAWGNYAEGAVNRSAKKAAASVGIKGFRAKDFRHSFLTEIYRLSKDLATVARFACHCPGSPMTARYTRAAHAEIDRSVAARFIVPTIPRPATVLRIAGRRRK